ncbi:MAG: tetratricopeptide repeat protein [Candidatus Kerfeldbacteria bacterium]|nr:tetratricopeptide repeat protein [Candidatus Kerfeldbacteria bacterium]
MWFSHWLQSIHDWFRPEPREIRYVRGILYVLLGLTPIIFIPGTPSIVELHKAFVVVCLALVAAGIYGWSVLRHHLVVVMPRIVQWLLLALVGFTVLSFVLARSHAVALTGIGDMYHSGAVLWLAYVLVAYCLVCVLHTPRQLWITLGALVGGTFVGLLVASLQSFEIFIFPWESTQYALFSPLANTRGIVSLLAAIIALGAGGLSSAVARSWRLTLVGISGVAALIWFRLYQPETAVLLGAGAIAVGMARDWHTRLTWKSAPVIPAILVLVALGAGLLYQSGMLTYVDSGRVALETPTAFVLARDRLIQSPFWGAGPNNFYFDFTLHRPIAFNDTAVWTARFVKTTTEWLGLAHQYGLGMVFVFIGIIVYTIHLSWRERIHSFAGHVDYARRLPLLVLVLWLMVTAYGLFANGSVLYWVWWWVLWAAWWVSMRIGINHQPVKTIHVQSSKPWLAPLIFAVGSAVALFGVYGAVRVWTADMYFARANHELATQGSFDDITDSVNHALKLNPSKLAYYQMKAAGYAERAQTTAARDGVTEAVQHDVQVVMDTLSQGQRHLARDPAYYEMTTGIYDSLRGIVGNVDQLSERAFSRAVELDPYNPLVRLNIGRALLLHAQRLIEVGEPVDSVNQLIDQAISDFNTAKSLKQDFVAPEYNIAIACQMRGDSAAARAHLEEAVASHPDDYDLQYALAGLYTDAGDYDRALSLYDGIIDVVPNHTGVFWQRSIIYEAQDNVPEAIKEIEKLLAIEPDYTPAQERLETLQQEE